MTYMNQRQGHNRKPLWLLYGLLSLLVIAAVFSVYALGGLNGMPSPALAEEGAGPPGDEPPIEEPPVENPPIEEPPIEEPPVEEPPIENPPVEEPPVEEPQKEMLPLVQPLAQQFVQPLAMPLAMPMMPLALTTPPDITFAVTSDTEGDLSITMQVAALNDLAGVTVDRIKFSLVNAAVNFSGGEHTETPGTTLAATTYTFPSVWSAWDWLRALDKTGNYACTLEYTIYYNTNEEYTDSYNVTINNIVTGFLSVSNVYSGGLTVSWKNLGLTGDLTGFGTPSKQLALQFDSTSGVYHRLIVPIDPLSLVNGSVNIPAYNYNEALHDAMVYLNGVLDPALADGNTSLPYWLVSGKRYKVQLGYYSEFPLPGYPPGPPSSPALYDHYINRNLLLDSPVTLKGPLPDNSGNEDNGNNDSGRDRDNNDEQGQNDLPYSPQDENAEITKEGAVTTLTHNEDGKPVLTTTVADYPITKAQEDGFTTLIIDLTKHLDMVGEDELGDLVQRLLFPQNAFDALDDDTVIVIISNNMEITLTAGELKKGGSNVGLEIEFYETSLPDSGDANTTSMVTDFERFGLPAYYAARGRNAPLYVARQVQANTRRVASNAFQISVAQVNTAGNKTPVTNFDNKPVTVNIPISAVKPTATTKVNPGAAAPRTNYVVKKYNEQSNTWESRPTVVTAQRVSFSSRTLSTFAIFETEVEAADVGADYKYADILAFLVENGIVKGTDEGNVEPYRDITLAELAALLARLDIRPAENFAAEYPGVPDAKWYYEELNTALARGYITEEESWRDPQATIPLQYAATMLFRYYNSQQQTPVVLEDEQQSALDFAATEQLFTERLLQDTAQPVSRENIFLAIYQLFARLFNIETAA